MVDASCIASGSVKKVIGERVCLPLPLTKGEAGRGSRRIHNLKHQQNNRRQLRKNQTEPEKRFWSWVRGKQLGTKFRRQHGIGRYIVDFYCAEFGLIIELDGESHYTEAAKKYDDKRSDFLNSTGFQVIRFTNLEVMNNKEGVLAVVLSFLKRPHPNPPLVRGGG